MEIAPGPASHEMTDHITSDNDVLMDETNTGSSNLQNVFKALSFMRAKLHAKLRTDFAIYLSYLNDWFSGRNTKDMFDHEMRKLLDEESIKLHNNFMKMILIGCYSNLDKYVPMQNEEERVNCPEPPIRKRVIELPAEGEKSEWLDRVLLRTVPEDEEYSPPDLKDQFPMPYVFEEMRPMDESCYGCIPGVTYPLNIPEKFTKNPKLKNFFGPTAEEAGQIDLKQISLFGRFLIRAWEFGLDGVDFAAGNLAMKACLEHIKSIIICAIKERKAFRMREDGTCHSIGAAYPNPYLLQGQHLYDEPCGSDSMKMADVMQMPPLLALKHEKERLAALQIASALPTKYSKYKNKKITAADLLDAINANPNIIPKNSLRQKLYESLLLNYKGFHGKRSLIEESESDEENEFPVCSY